MPGMMEGLSTLNSFLRTLVAMVVLGGVGVAGYFGYTTYNANEIEAEARSRELAAAQKALTDSENRLKSANSEIARQDQEIKQKAAEITKLNADVERLETSLALLKVDHRVARLTAVDQTQDEATGKFTTLVEFVELNDEGHPIDTPRQFRIPGDTVYVDGWLVQFEDKYVEQHDLERGTSLILFKRLFGSGQKPEDGYPLDEVGAAPRVYARGSRMSDFEKTIWSDFWSIANDSSKAEQLGIRAAHGEAPSMRVEKGKSYKVMLRASGGLSIVPDTEGPVAR